VGWPIGRFVRGMTQPTEPPRDETPVADASDAPSRAAREVPVTNGSLLFGGATIALLVAGFFPWFTATYSRLQLTGPTAGASLDGSRSAAGYNLVWVWWLPVVLALIITVDLFSGLLSLKVPALRHPSTPLAVGAVVALLVLVAVLRGDELGLTPLVTTNGHVTVSSSRETAAWFGAAAALLIGVAGTMLRRERLGDRAVILDAANVNGRPEG
jgi:hypothetical protein